LGELGVDLLVDSVLALSSVQLDSVVLDLLWVGLRGDLDVDRVGSDVGVNISPHLLDIIRSLSGLDVLGELGLVLLLVSLLEVSHVISNVSSEDVLAKNGGIEVLGVSVVTRETLVLVRDLETSVNSTLHGTEDTGTSGGVVETNVEENVEWTTALGFLNKEVLSIRLALADVLLVKTELGEDTTSSKETSGVGSGVVLLAGLGVDVSSILGQLMGVGSSKDDIAVEGSIGDLASDILVGETDDKSVLRGVVLVLVLSDQSLTGLVVGLALTSTSELDLEALVVSLVLDDLDEWHLSSWD